MTTAYGVEFAEGATEEQPRRSTSDGRTILRLLGDDYARRILACSDQPKTATEIANECGLPTSTTYRKVDQLQDAGLLEESLRPSVEGKHATEYRRVIDRISVSFPGGVTVECRHRRTSR